MKMAEQTGAAERRRDHSSCVEDSEECSEVAKVAPLIDLNLTRVDHEQHGTWCHFKCGCVGRRGEIIGEWYFTFCGEHYRRTALDDKWDAVARGGDFLAPISERTIGDAMREKQDRLAREVLYGRPQW